MLILKYFPDSPEGIPVTQGQLFLGPVNLTGNEKTFLAWMVLRPF